MLVKDIKVYVPSSVEIYIYSCVKSTKFKLCNNENNTFSNFTVNTPDIVVVVDEDSREVTILEVSCTFDYSLEEAFATKVLK